MLSEASSCKVKHQHFCVFAAMQGNLTLALDQRGIARAQRLSVDLEFTAHQKHIAFARRIHFQRGSFSPVKVTSVERGIGMDRDRALRAIG